MPHFECGAFNHSATSPEGAKKRGEAPVVGACSRRGWRARQGARWENRPPFPAKSGGGAAGDGANARVFRRFGPIAPEWRDRSDAMGPAPPQGAPNHPETSAPRISRDSGFDASHRPGMTASPTMTMRKRQRRNAPVSHGVALAPGVGPPDAVNTGGPVPLIKILAGKGGFAGQVRRRFDRSVQPAPRNAIRPLT